jgi:hypothetical protein
MKNAKIMLFFVSVVLVAGGVFFYAKQSFEETMTKNQSATTSRQTIPSKPLWEDVDEKLHISSSGFSAGMPNSMKISNDLRVRNVYFCRAVYKAKQVFIDDVDIIKRLSDLLKENPEKSKWYCEIIWDRALKEGGVLGGGEEIDITIEGGESYGISVSLSRHPASSFPFFIDIEKNTISYTDGGILGDLK